MSLKKVAEAIRKNNNFLITVHTNPEGDALGAELAFYRLLKAQGKSAFIINEDPAPMEYGFLSGINNIKTLKKNFKKINFDCFVVLDCSDLSRCTEVARLNKDNKFTINIDHHICNEKFANVNWVDTKVSSTCEMIYRLYKYMGIAIDTETALALYVGILTDTGSFRYSNTTARTHAIAADLLRFNLDAAGIYKNLYASIPYEDMQLLANILPRMKRRAGGKIIWFKIPKSLLENRKISFDLTENILNFARSVKGIEVAALFKENLGVENEVRVNLRSQGEVDVNKIAQFFGGGGHKTASGCTIRGSIGDIPKRVLAKIEAALQE